MTKEEIQPKESNQENLEDQPQIPQESGEPNLSDEDLRKMQEASAVEYMEGLGKKADEKRGKINRGEEQKELAAARKELEEGFEGTKNKKSLENPELEKIYKEHLGEIKKLRKKGIGNYYEEILGIKQDASQEQIEEALRGKEDFYNSIKEFYQFSESDDAKMIRDYVKNILDVYKILSDPEKRKEYDEGLERRRKNEEEAEAFRKEFRLKEEMKEQETIRLREEKEKFEQEKRLTSEAPSREQKKNNPKASFFDRLFRRK